MYQASLPTGSRDLLFEATRKKHTLIRQFEENFWRWGYQMVETPGVEYLNTFQRGLAGQDDRFVKVISDDQEVLTLRADMTLPIARVVATKFKNHKQPLRFAYTKNVFGRSQKYSGSLSEVTDSGCELIGLPGEAADLEIVLLVLDTMTTVIDLPFILELGDIRFFRGICDYLQLTAAQTNRLSELINHKYLPALEQYVDALDLPEELAQFFKDFPFYRYSGGIEVLERLRRFAFTSELTDVLDEMARLVEWLTESGYAENIRLDFSKIPALDYYSGFIFEGYYDQVAQPVVTGGRYDKLVGQLNGRDEPAIGFAIKTDYLLALDLPQQTSGLVIIKYPQSDFLKAQEKAQALRKTGARVILEEAEQQEITTETREEPGQC